jgi:DnaJ-class molecular chaperone
MTKEGATPEDVAKAFKKMAIKWHPAGAYTRSEFSST